MKRKILVVGNGMAGVRCVEEILALSPSAFEITIVGAEPHPNYNRILLSKVLGGEGGLDDIVLNPYAWYAEQGVTLHAGKQVLELDGAARVAKVSGGLELGWDELILATGSVPFMLPLPGAEKAGVIAFRDIKDCEAMRDAARRYRDAVVIGGGLLGLEAARGLLNLGMRARVVHVLDCLMERQLDPFASKLLQQDLERQGMLFTMEAQSEQILGGDRVQALQLKDGRVLPADLLVMAVGIRPNVALAKASGLQVNKGIVCDDFLRTSHEHVWAVGECAEHRGIAYGLVAPLYEQAAVLARALCGAPGEPYGGSAIHTKLKVSGVDVFSAGEFNEHGETKAYRFRDDFNGIYKKILARDGRVVGGVLYGDTSDSGKILQLMKETDGESRLAALFGGPPKGLAEQAGVEAMADEAIVCSCNGVSKRSILDAIKAKGCTNVEQVKGYTNAARSCGGCKPLVQDLLKWALGPDLAEEKESVCGCTELSRDEVVSEIRAKGMTTSKEVRLVLGWREEEGCSKCRPALNYYLNMLYPGEHGDESGSRFVNERLHANIQKDGTFSVVPRIRGGVTNPQELRKIADAAEKFKVPMVKITGGQRIDLLGVKKEDLPAIWAELDMPSGYAYAKALRTVKTCVGSEFCRFGVGDSTSLGIALEKKFEMLNTPAKVKLAVSGCPRNCAECSIKDVGVVAVDGGQWDVFTGGNGGVSLKGAELLARVDSPEEVIALTAAYLQHYRETAQWNERTAPWQERVGLEAVKKVVLDPRQQAALVARMDATLATYTDPWAAAVKEPVLWRDPAAPTVGRA